MTKLTENSLLVSLEINQWTARKFDKSVTDKVDKDHDTKDAGRFNKSLIAREHLEAIGKIATRARAYHYDNTLPWSDKGERLLPSTNFFAYSQEILKLKMEFETAVNVFSLGYPGMILEAQTRLKNLFDSKDYPSVILDRFKIRTQYMPVPDVDDIRVKLDAADVDNIRKSVSEEVNRRFAEAQKDIYARIKEQLKRMHERLTVADGVFRNSLFENVRDMVELLPRLNVANDPHITELCSDLQNLYADPEKVRTDGKLRMAKAQEVTAMLSKMDGFFGK